MKQLLIAASFLMGLSCGSFAEVYGAEPVDPSGRQFLQDQIAVYHFKVTRFLNNESSLNFMEKGLSNDDWKALHDWLSPERDQVVRNGASREVLGSIAEIEYCLFVKTGVINAEKWELKQYLSKEFLTEWEKVEPSQAMNFIKERARKIPLLK